MKKFLLYFINLFEQIIITIIKTFFYNNNDKKHFNKSNFKENNFENFYSINSSKSNDETDNDSGEANSSREMYKEYLKQNITKKDINKIINKIIEKTFKIKIKNLNNNECKRLTEYKNKIIKPLYEKVKKQKIKNISELKNELELKIKSDKNSKQLQSNAINNLNLKKDETNINKENNFKNATKKIEQPIILHKTPKPFYKQDIYTKKSISIPSKSNSASLKIISSKNNDQVFSFPQKVLSTKKILANAPTEDIEKSSITNAKDQNIFISENFISTKPSITSERKTPISETSLINKDNNKNQKIKINQKKENNNDKPVAVTINSNKIIQETNIIIEKSKQEYSKKDFLDKEYELVEKLISTKISEIESILNKNLDENQKKLFQNELKKLKISQEKIKLHKEKDLEKIRLSLEENIPYDELLLVNQKLKEFHDNNKFEKDELLYQNLENKSQKDINNLEKLLIKKSFKKALKPLELPLFISIPFIKNRFFKKFISGLIVFRSFQFIKSIIFKNALEFEPINLNYIENGRDALNESIIITEKNIALFKNLKTHTILKYPELVEDEEFLIYINKLEINLNKKYEKLIKYEKTINKYFNKSKKLLRKRKINY